MIGSEESTSSDSSKKNRSGLFSKTSCGHIFGKRLRNLAIVNLKLQLLSSLYLVSKTNDFKPFTR